MAEKPSVLLLPVSCQEDGMEDIGGVGIYGIFTIEMPYESTEYACVK